MSDASVPRHSPHDNANAERSGGVSRRSFMKSLGLSAAASSLVTSRVRAASSGADSFFEDDGAQVLGPDPVSVTLNINDEKVQVKVEPATTLLEALRPLLKLTGTKEICDRGACGGCSVLLNGKLVNACMMLAIDAAGAKITTIEGLSQGDQLDPIQVAFVKHDAMQCGYCTPGFVMASRAVLNQYPRPTLVQIKRGLSGNICRCGCYSNIFNAVLEASGQPPIMDQKGV